ncbi:MAG: amino acid adenylation domain-containing protein, partial [Candidatus Aminicenantes bacterium]
RPQLTAEKFDHDFWDYHDYHDEKKLNLSIKNYKQKINKKLFRGVQGGGFLEKSPPMLHGARRQKIYKTGDMARWTSWGVVEFLGRIDSQVKIRGYRIELGEIEKRLLTHEGINEAVVIVREHPSADKYLCAYIVLKNPGSINGPALKEHLAIELPDYMIPTFFVELERIPLTPNGKLNRKLLPEPEMGGLAAYYAAPRNPIEQKLAEVWQEILEVDRIGIDDQFFQLGGHSLKAIILISRMNKAFHVTVPLAEIFRTPTIRGLSAYITSKQQGLFTPIEPMEEKDYHALSSAQKRLYFLHQLDEDSTSYNMPYVLRLEGEVNRGKLAEIFLRLIVRHESLRTSFGMLDGEPVQRIHNDVEFEIEYYQGEVKVKEEKEPFGQVLNAFGGHSPKSQELKAKSYIYSFIRPFDLSHAPLLRVRLIKLLRTPTALGGHPCEEGKENKYLLMVDMHHIISDGISRRLLVREFMALAAEKDLAPLRLQYKDFSAWQNRDAQREAQIKQKAYWKKQLAGEIPVLDLPLDYVRPTMQRFAGSTVTFTIEQEEVKALQSLALAEGMTLYMILLAIYYILLSKLSNQEDILVGTPTAGRRHADLQQIIGMFVNTLVLRNYPQGDKTYGAFLKEIKARTLQAFENQDYPYEELVEEVTITRDTSRNPLFDTMFVLQNMGIPRIEIPGLKLTPDEHQIEISKFDLTLTATEAEAGLQLIFEYSTCLFKKSTIERFTNYFRKVVSVVISNPNIKICEVEILGEEEKKELLYDFNNTAAEYQKDKVIQELFMEQAEKSPDSIAVIGPLLIAGHTEPSRRRPTEDTLHGAFSYGKLNKISEQLAYFLKEKGVGPDTVVGIILERSIEIIIGILGILKSEGAYLLIDHEYPLERIDYFLADSSAQVLISTNPTGTLAKKVEKLKCWEEKRKPGLIFLDSLQFSYFSSCHPLTFSPSSLAYLIYTSGTTGKPKGVMVDHRNAIAYLHAFYSEFDIRPTDTVIQLVSYSFDAFVEEVFPILLKGGKIVIAGVFERMDIDLLSRLIIRHHVTIVDCTPLLLNEFNQLNTNAGNSGDNPLESVHTFIGGGDILKQEYVNNLIRTGKVYNTYGPTESTVCATYYQYTHLDEKNPVNAAASIPIGKSISNYKVYILDEYNKPVPIGVTGEICIAGDGVTRGYLNRPELTREKFIPNPFEDDGMLYRSGDLAKWRRCGNIEFLGRIDHQVKIRGFRIELGEIESQLTACDEIKEAVVLDKEDKNGGKYLCAYIVPREELGTAKLREYLAENLPDFMIPSYFMQIDDIPLTPTGKIDRSALPSPQIGRVGKYLAPRDEMERRLAQIWGEVLQLSVPIG